MPRLTRNSKIEVTSALKNRADVSLNEKTTKRSSLKKQTVSQGDEQRDEQSAIESKENETEGPTGDLEDDSISQLTSNKLDDLDAMLDYAARQPVIKHKSQQYAVFTSKVDQTNIAKRVSQLKPSTIIPIVETVANKEVIANRGLSETVGQKQNESVATFLTGTRITLATQSKSHVLVNRRRSAGRTFGSNRTVMPDKHIQCPNEMGSSPNQRIASARLMNNDQEDDPLHKKVDEGLSSSDDEDDKKCVKIRSIYELREAGETTRFRDEMAYYHDGLRNTQPLRMQRSTLLDLCRKLNNDKFVASIRAHDYTKVLFELVAPATDELMQCMLVYFLWVLSKDARHLEPLYALPKLIDATLRPLLSHSDIDLTVQIPETLSKSDKLFIRDFQQVVRKSHWLDGQHQTISKLSFALDILLELCNVRGALSDKLSCAIHEHGVFDIIIDLIVDMHNTKNSDSEDSKLLMKCVRVIDFSTSRLKEAPKDAKRIRLAMEHFLDFTNNASKNAIEAGASECETTLSILRVALNLANETTNNLLGDHNGWFTALLNLLNFAETAFEVLDNDERWKQSNNSDEADNRKERSVQFDMVLLCVSLMSNLAESSPISQKYFSEPDNHVNSEAPKKRSKKATLQTQPTRTNLLIQLLEKHVQHRVDSMDHFIMSSHLAILVATILKTMGRESAQEYWRKLVDDSRQATIALLYEFMELHKQVVLSQPVNISDTLVESGAAKTQESILERLHYLESLN